MSGKIDGVVLPVFYQTLDSDAIPVNHLGSGSSVARAPVYGENERSQDKNSSEMFFHLHHTPA